MQITNRQLCAIAEHQPDGCSWIRGFVRKGGNEKRHLKTKAMSHFSRAMRWLEQIGRGAIHASPWLLLFDAFFMQHKMPVGCWCYNSPPPTLTCVNNGEMVNIPGRHIICGKVTKIFICVYFLNETHELRLSRVCLWEEADKCLTLYWNAVWTGVKLTELLQWLKAHADHDHKPMLIIKPNV